MSLLLDINNIETCFRTEDRVLKILDGVTIQVKKGEIVGLVGESGSGKSVTMMSSIQLLSNSGKVTSGRVELDENGHAEDPRRPHRYDIPGTHDFP